MEITEFTFQIILIFIPGLIAFVIIDNLTVHREYKVNKIILYSFLLGFCSYLLYYMFTLIPKVSITFSFEHFSKATNNIDYIAILITTGFSIIIGFLFSYFITHKYLFRLAHSLRISKKFGDIDVWSYIMNSDIPEWGVVRDIQQDLMYEGWIQAFSDSSDNINNNELFLRDVKVYKNSTAEELYEVPGLYISRIKDNITVEFPLIKFKPNNKNNYKEEQ